MRKSSLVAASMVILAFGCSDATNPIAPQFDVDQTPQPSVSAVADAPSLAAVAATLAPDPADRILLDTRTSLQRATSLWSAKAAFSPNYTASGPWGFTSNVDGAGTNALRVTWPRRWSTTCKYASATLSVPLPTPRATRMYVQWKQHLGRTETGGGSGAVGEFIIADRCRGVARAEMTALRAGTGEATRLEYRWMTPTPLSARVSAFVDPVAHFEALPGSTFRPAERAGTTVTQTLYLQAESAPGARDGVVRLWVDGTLVVEQTGVAIGTAAFRRIRFPGRMALAMRPQTEYFWDVVAWEPATTPEEPPPPPTPIAAINITPASATLSVGSNLQLSAALLDANGDTIRGRAVTWQSSAPEIASVGVDGIAAGVAAGSATITASAEGKSGSATITVQAVPVASITLAPATAAVDIGKTVQLTATARDADGNVLTGRTITWETSVATTATVSASGLVTGVAAGSATITASSEGKSGSSAVTVRTPAPVPVASITIAPQTASIEVNATRQLAATTRDAGGAVLTGRVVTWESLNQTVATVSASGLVTGVAAGTAMVRGTSESVSDTATITVTSPTPPPPPPPANGIPDPTLLPRATGQRPLAGTYGRNLAAGQTYVDPNSGVTVLKLTSSSVPTANGSMYHGYSEGGPVISQPWTGTDGQVYYTAYIGGWLVDVRYGTFTTTNYRRVDSDGEVGFAFSLNPATPRIAYTVTNWGGNRVDRYNTATNQVENTGHWPWIASASGQYLTWLQNNLNDEWFVAMLNSNHTVVAFRPSDGTQRTITGAAAGVSIDEPHIDREFPYIYLSTNSSVRNKIVNLETMTYTDPRDVNGVNADDHAAPLRGKIVAVTWQGNGIVAVDYRGNVTLPVTPSPTDWRGDWHMAGQWVFNNPTDYFVVDQWQGTGSYAIYKDMIGFVNLAGDMRLIAHSNGTGQGYDTGGQPHPTLAPDGKLLMFVSNMGGAGRSDVFMVRLPVR